MTVNKELHVPSCERGSFLFTILPFEASKLLRVAHDLAKVDVKHVPAVLQHDVVIVTVTDAQDEGGHTPACAGVDEVHHSLQTEALFYTSAKKPESKSQACERSG